MSLLKNAQIYRNLTHHAEKQQSPEDKSQLRNVLYVKIRSLMSKSRSIIGVMCQEFTTGFIEPQLILMKLTFPVSHILLPQPTTHSFSLQPFHTLRLEKESCGNSSSKREINKKKIAYVWLLVLPHTSCQIVTSICQARDLWTTCT